MRAYEWHGVLATHKAPPAAAAAVVIVGLNKEDMSRQSTDQTMRRCVMLLCVLDGAVTRWRPVAKWPLLGPFRRGRMTVLAIIIALWIQWAVGQCTCETCVGAWYCISLGAAKIARLLIPRYHLIDMNPI